MPSTPEAPTPRPVLARLAGRLDTMSPAQRARRRWLLRIAVVGFVALLGGFVVQLGALAHGLGWW